jgi:eukaryotic-like serine/threonine-protein kinase
LLLLAATVVAGLVGWAVIGLSHLRQRQEEAAAQLTRGHELLEARNFGQAAAALQRGIILLSEVPGNTALHEQLLHELQRAERGQSGQQLHQLADRMRFVSDASASAGSLPELQSQCERMWASRAALLNAAEYPLSTASERQIQADLLDLVLTWAALDARSESKTDRQQALQVLAEAEATFGPSIVLYREREMLARQLGQTALAEESARRAAQLQPRTAWEYYALGRAYLQSGDLNEAAQALQQAVDMRPQEFWPHFAAGICGHRRQRYSEAVTAFTVCVALAPDSAECYYNRALALSAQAKTERALRNYDRAIELNPRMAAAFLNRGVLLLKQGSAEKAQADLEQALAGGADPATVYFNLAQVHRGRHQDAAALDSARRALAANPQHAGAQQLLKQLQAGR